MTTTNSPASSKETVVRFTIPENTNFDIKSAAGVVRTNKNDFMRQLIIDVANGDLTYPVYDQYQAIIQQCEEREELTMCDRWLEPNGQGLINFIQDIPVRPSMSHFITTKWSYSGNKLVEGLEYSAASVVWATTTDSVDNSISDRSKERIELISKMVTNGSTIDQMAAALKTSPQKVRFFISRLGLDWYYTFHLLTLFLIIMTITTAVTQTTYTIVSQYTFEELWSQAIDAFEAEGDYDYYRAFADDYVDEDNNEIVEAVRAALSLDDDDCQIYDAYDSEEQEYDEEFISPIRDKFELVSKYFPTRTDGNYILNPSSLSYAPLEYLQRIVSDYKNFDIDVTEEECDEGYSITVEVGDIPSTIHSEFISHIFEWLGLPSRGALLLVVSYE